MKTFFILAYISCSLLNPLNPFNIINPASPWYQFRQRQRMEPPAFRFAEPQLRKEVPPAPKRSTRWELV